LDDLIDLFFEGVLGDEAVDEDVVLLADAVGAVCEGAALRYIGHCSMAVGMPHSAALEMASHWILASLRS